MAAPAILDRIAAALLQILPRFTPAEQRLSLPLYRLLAEGRPVPRARLAPALGSAEREVDTILAGDGFRLLVYCDEADRVIGCGGLAVVPMYHRFEVDGRTRYTCCAWDRLLIPEMLGRPARVESPCPEPGERVRLQLTPQGMSGVSHAEAVVSFLVPDTLGSDVHKTMASFCHYVSFLASPVARAAWTSRHPGTFLLSLAQAFEPARQKHAAQFGDVAWSGTA